MSYRDEYNNNGSGAGANYYDQKQDFSGRDNSNSNSYGNQGNQNYGRQESHGNYGSNDNYGNQGNQSYGRQEGSGEYGSNNNSGSYGQESHGRRNSGSYGQQESHGRRNSGNYGSDDFSSAADHAQEHHGSEDKSLFSSALNFINDRKGQYSGSGGDVDEQHAVNAHQAMYGSGSNSNQNHDSNTVGAGAAMQALKMFTGGGSGGSSSDGGMDKNKLIGLAMAQAGKLWDEKQGSGGNVSGDKQSAVNSAAEMALKMYMKSQGGGVGGTGGAGGASGLLSLASKFL
ncbi:hypothetical protein MYU51_005683 [Penicillium brevicompactum]|uniref:uncharacterized protein n=1 Tax=Penicillium brevicompactum TaxID=5074 RepID=UPI0025419F57|nr:uncharacterized protein N7506_004672 [Penicillium brevicompactum]KAJ5336650.1 hypothetical protein N7506_004672 [Penicillium brevicompactum]